MFYKILCLHFLVLLHLCCYAQPGTLSLPLAGVQGKDYFVDYYVSHPSADTFFDFRCGSKTYNGHTGTDFILRSFRQMDSGVNVHAALDGVVDDVQNGHYDRSKHWQSGGLGNYVCIRYNKYYLFYGHLKNNSIKVSIGDTIRAGQIIGQVGSSGYSAFPHLHFEIRDDVNRVIDPSGKSNCNNDTAFTWGLPIAYDTALYCIDNGFVPYKPGYDTLLERYVVRDTFSAKNDETVCFWALIHGLRPGYKLQYFWLTPEHLLWYTSQFTWEYHWWYDYSWAYLNVPKEKGTWTVEYWINDRFIISRKFTVVK